MVAAKKNVISLCVRGLKSIPCLLPQNAECSDRSILILSVEMAGQFLKESYLLLPIASRIYWVAIKHFMF